MKNPVFILNFSGVYEAQGFLPWLRSQEAETVLSDASGIEGTCCYCDAEAKVRIGALLPSELPRIRWVDSGDYHYMSQLLAMRETAPFHLLLMDHHPDNQEPVFGAEVLSCGSWVKVLQEECPLLRSILAIGPEENPEENPDGLPEEPAELRLQAWLEARKGERVYVSLDKDVMDRRWARTDWTQGTYSLERVEGLLGQVLESGVEVAAVDLCGEVAPGRGDSPEDQRINKETNIELYTFLINHLK